MPLVHPSRGAAISLASTSGGARKAVLHPRLLTTRPLASKISDLETTLRINTVVQAGVNHGIGRATADSHGSRLTNRESPAVLMVHPPTRAVLGMIGE